MAKLGSKKQIVFIHGGDSYSSYDKYLHNLEHSKLDYSRLLQVQRWSDTLSSQLSEADVLVPQFPNKQNANYNEWEIYFQKLLPFLGSDVRLIGHSLGAMFLAKYLHTRPLKKPVNQLILLAGGYNNPDTDYGSFKLESATELDKSARQIHLFHSRDDFVVDFGELAKFQADLPAASLHIFDDRNHFLNSDFPELIELLKK